MSHWATVKAEITDMDALEDALKKMGYKNIKRNAEARGWSDSKKCDLVVVGKDRFDIGFQMRESGCNIVGDFSMMDVDEETFRDNVSQNYAYVMTMQGLQAKGLMAIQEHVEADGTIKLVVNLGNRYDEVN